MNINEKALKIIDSCRFCWMCRHVCPVGNATGLERNTSRARALGASLVVRGAEKIDEIIDNIYECTLCGACTNNCVTGWDPKVFIRELKTQAILEGVIPEYVEKLIEKYNEFGNVYGKTNCKCLNDLGAKSDTLFFAGVDATINAPETVKQAIQLLNKGGVTVDFKADAPDSGEQLYFLTGKTAETLEAAKKCAELLNSYKKVIVYDPMDLKLMLHEYKEWGVEVKAEIVGFNAFLLQLLKEGAIKVQKSIKEYTAQDHFAYSRDLDDSVTIRKIIDSIGQNKEMLLIAKEANMAGSLLMKEYMPDVMLKIAKERLVNAKNMNCFTIVTSNPAEYVLLKEVADEQFTILSVEQAILENLK